MEIGEYEYETLPPSYHSVVCWCIGCGDAHQRMMYVNDEGEWSENYDVICWIDVPIPD